MNVNEYIDEYIRNCSDADKKVARHLKEIIPKTYHLDKTTFDEIVEEIKIEINNGMDFKAAFNRIHKNYFLGGDVITADLPDHLTRIILNKTAFISGVKKSMRTPYKTEEIENIFAKKKRKQLMRLLGNIRLAKKEVVFATFDEYRKDGRPLLEYGLKDITNRLGLDETAFAVDESLTAVAIKYRNVEGMETYYPTFIDAGWYDKFFPAGKEDNYGRTKSLDPALEGMPEIVHGNLTLSEVMVDIVLLEE